MAKEYTNAEILEAGKKAIERQQKDAIRNKARMQAYTALGVKYAPEFKKLYEAALEE